MIEAALARKFIEQVAQYTDYNINIMNEQGVIIASRDPARVGRFHEVAYYIITTKEDVIVTSSEDDYPGVKPGINMVVNIDGRREGVVGITGNPEEIRSVALIIKMAIEAMLKYENQQVALQSRKTKKERFVTLLTHEEFSDPLTLRSMASQLNYSESIIRIPILCRLEEIEPLPFLEMIKVGQRHSHEDISFVLDDTHILIFKSMPKNSANMFSDYKYIIAEYLSHALQWLRKQEKTCKFYIGSFQGSFSQYYYAYMHCKWLEETVEPAGSSAFFYDYAENYMRKIVPVNELQRMFNTYEKGLSKEFLQSFIEIMGALIHTNYNLVEASKVLFMHKNTLQYRYNKMKDTLNANPIASSSDRFFLEAFYSYLRNER